MTGSDLDLGTGWPRPRAGRRSILLGVVLGVLTVAGCTSTTAGHPSASASASAGSGSTPPAG
ncbi:MAG TPA: hypothetical protein VGL21_02685, partial [Jatrophihabitantaceae bacterium]